MKNKCNDEKELKNYCSQVKLAEIEHYYFSLLCCAGQKFSFNNFREGSGKIWRHFPSSSSSSGIERTAGARYSEKSRKPCADFAATFSDDQD